MKNFQRIILNFILCVSLLTFVCNLTASGQALLEPPDGRVYHGVQLMTYEGTPDPIAGYLAMLDDNTIQPAVRGFFFSIPGERGPANTLAGLNKFFLASDSIGFIPELSLFLIGSEGATDSIIAVSNKYDNIIDSIITLSKNYGKKMFLRIGGEFNGAGQDWNGGGYHPYLYVTMFRKIVDKFAAAGLRDSIAVNWCYEPDAANDFDSVDARGARWYPGDSYADWFGLDVFSPTHFDLSLPDFYRGSITKKGKSIRFLAMAQRKDKPVFLSETSAQGINISADSTDGVNDWNSWFAKFFNFISSNPLIKGYCYINANWPEGAYSGWGDARIENSPYVTQKYREEMKSPQYIHLNMSAVQIPAKVILVSPANAAKIDTNNVKLVWKKGEPGVTNYHLQVGNSSQMNDLRVDDNTLTDTTYRMSQLYVDSFYVWRVRAKNDEGWGPWSDMRYFTVVSAADTLFTAKPLTEFGNDNYKSYPGGLYPGNTNQRPTKHNDDGINLAKSIVPLDKTGQQDSDSGRIVLLSIGMSNTTQEYSRFKGIADTFKLKNPKLIIVDGAQGGQTASIIKNPDAKFWRVIDTARLPQARVSNLQVQAVWLKEANAGPTQAFPVHANMLRDDLRDIVRLLPLKFPNLKLVYISSRTFGGYATTQLNPEPYAYESGFSVKWLIEQQISGDTALAYDSPERRAPWLSWGPYLWADGPNPRLDDGLFWLQDDFGNDGTHPSDKGRMKVANLLLDFFSTDKTTKPWFLAEPTSAGAIPEQQAISIFPNPASDYIEISGGNVILSEAKDPCIKIYDILGIEQPTSPQSLSMLGEGITIDVSHLPPGVYFVRIENYYYHFMVIR